MRSLARNARNALTEALRFLTGRRPDSPHDPHAALALDEPD